MLRHADVHQHDIHRHFGFQQRQRLEAVFGLAGHAGWALPCHDVGEQLLQAGARRRLVVDHQHPQRIGVHASDLR
jgi:hypothetical protein